mgnify:CR=1 FL=1|jgi:hypothetical protein
MCTIFSINSEMLVERGTVDLLGGTDRYLINVLLVRLQNSSIDGVIRGRRGE